MAPIDPQEPGPPGDDMTARPEHDAASVARSLATVDGRPEDQAYIDYLTAVNEVTSPSPDVQVEGIARLGRLVVHPEHGGAAVAILHSFAAEAGAQPDGLLSPAAALLAKEILTVRPEPEPVDEDRTAIAPPLPPRFHPAAEDRPRRRRRWVAESAVMARHVLGGHPAVWVLALAAAVAAGLGNLAYAGVVAFLADRASPGLAGMSLAAVVFGGIAVVMVVRSIGIYGYRVMTERMQIRLAAQDRRAAIRAYLGRPQFWADQRSLDQAMAVVRGDGERTWYAAASLPFALGTAVAAAAAVAVVARVDRVAGVVAALILAALVVLTLLHLSRITEPSRRASCHAGEVRTAAADCVDAAAAVDALGVVPHGGAKLVGATAGLRDARVRIEAVRARYDVLLELTPVAGILLAVPLVAVRPDGGAAGLAMAAVLVSGIALQVRAGAWLLAELPAGVVRWRYTRRFVRSGEDMRYGKRELPPAVAGPGELRFERCGVTDRTGRVVLPRLDLVVPDGSLVAVAGATAEEAAVITALAARQLDPTSGAVTLAGADLRELTSDTLADRIGWVSGECRLAGPPGPRLLVADDIHDAGAGTGMVELASAARGAPALSALVVTNRRGVLALADEVVYLHGGQVVARGSHDWLLENVPGYTALVLGFDGDEGVPACPDATECADETLDEANERYHAADRLAAAAAAPRSFAVLRRAGTTCHAHRTSGGAHQSGRRRAKTVAEDTAVQETQETQDVLRTGAS